MPAHHWTRAPTLYYIFCCLVAFSYITIPSCWLAEPHNSPSAVSHKLSIPIQSFNNQLESAGYCKQSRQSCASTIHCNLCALHVYLVHNSLIYLDTWGNHNDIHPWYSFYDHIRNPIGLPRINKAKVEEEGTETATTSPIAVYEFLTQFSSSSLSQMLLQSEACR